MFKISFIITFEYITYFNYYIFKFLKNNVVRKSLNFLQYLKGLLSFMIFIYNLK